MKTYNITTRFSKQAKAAIEEIISTHECYKKSYFFTPASSANTRRRNEQKFAENCPDITFIMGKKTIIVSRTYSESCANVYYALQVKVNEEIKDIRFIKGLQKVYLASNINMSF